MALTGRAFVMLVRGIAGLLVENDIAPVISRGASVDSATFCEDV
jgi:hypothetical protein